MLISEYINLAVDNVEQMLDDMLHDYTVDKEQLPNRVEDYEFTDMVVNELNEIQIYLSENSVLMIHNTIKNYVREKLIKMGYDYLYDTRNDD